jgi:hypothetical protein
MIVQIERFAKEEDLMAKEKALEREKAAVEAERERLEQQMARIEEERASNIAEVRCMDVLWLLHQGPWGQVHIA